MNSEYKFGLIYLLAKQKSELQILLSISAILLAIGLFFTGPLDPNCVILFDLLSRNVWVSLFTVYAVVKAVSCFYNISGHLRTITGTFGLWAWNYTFLSFVVFDSSYINPTELLLLVPLVIELWTMLGNNFNKNDHKEVSYVK
jgi:hypothetical protein